VVFDISTWKRSSDNKPTCLTYLGIKAVILLRRFAATPPKECKVTGHNFII